MSTIPLDLRLSEHFVLREFVTSATAVRLKIDNSPQWCHVARLIDLCQHVLEPLRREFGPLVINSGYRCEALNRAVGGVARSQHVQGEAADVRAVDQAHAQRMYDYVRAHLVYDQVLLERSRRTGAVWLHVSYRRDELKNRRQALRLTVAEAAHTCSRCGRTLPVEQFNRLPSGHVRNVCNHCRWVHTIQPSRHRGILRALVA